MSQRIGVIGLGSIAAKAYLPVLGSWEGLDLFLCSRREESVARYQAKYHIPHGSTDLQALLDWSPQAAFVLASTPAHFELVSRLLAAGADVYVEKPAAGTSEETRSLAELADRMGRVLMVGFNRRYAPLHRQARQLWGDRPVDLAVFQKQRVKPFHPDLYNQYLDDNIHQIDHLRFFCGECTAIHTEGRVDGGWLVSAASTAALPGGGIGWIAASLRAGKWQERYALYGQGALLILDAFSRLMFIENGQQRVWEETYDSSWKTTLEGRGVVGEIAHFFECLQSRAQPLTSAWDSVRTQELLEDMVRRAQLL